MNIPKIGLGTGGLDYNNTYNTVLSALKLGYRLIDTAENYHNEEAVGKAIIDSGIDRKEITIISKYFGGNNFGKRNDIMISIEKSLKKLQTHYIDIYLIHMPGGCIWNSGQWNFISTDSKVNYKDRLHAWIEMNELKKINIVKNIGVSNWTQDNIEQLQINNLNLPDIIQIEWCPQYYDLKLYNYCTKNNILIIGYGSLSRSCKNYDSSKLLQWAKHRNIIVIPKSSNPEHLLRNLELINSDDKLSTEEIIEIDSLLTKEKGHCLKTIYETNIPLNLYKPLIVNKHFKTQMKYTPIHELIDGKISCVVIKKILNYSECASIIGEIDEKKLFTSTGLGFRGNEIGITIDKPIWRDNPLLFWEECDKVNKYFETLFKTCINPFDTMVNAIQNIAGDTIKVTRMENKSGILCPKGVFRMFVKRSGSFPYHTDGFNYGKIFNQKVNLNRNNYPVMSLDYNTNSILAVILILEMPETKNEVNLYNCLVDDLEQHIDEIGMYSHWMGTKYTNINALEKILETKQYYSPLLNTGDLYIFSTSRIHKVDNFVKSDKRRIVLATFFTFDEKNNIITIYQ